MTAARSTVVLDTGLLGHRCCLVVLHFVPLAFSRLLWVLYRSVVSFSSPRVVLVSTDAVGVGTCSSCHYKTDSLDGIHLGCQTECVSGAQVGDLRT